MPDRPARVVRVIGPFMTDTLVIALAQLNPTVGDIQGNLARIREARAASTRLRSAGVRRARADRISAGGSRDASRRASRRRGAPSTSWRPTRAAGRGARDDAVARRRRRLQRRRAARWRPHCRGSLQARAARTTACSTRSASSPRVRCRTPIDFRGVRLGIPICEDIWFPAVAAHLAKQGAEILIVPNGSPFEREKVGRRIALATDRVRETGLPLVYINQVGGQDELVFDGGSFVINRDEQLVVALPGLDRGDARRRAGRVPRTDGRARRSRSRRCLPSRATPTRR